MVLVCAMSALSPLPCGCIRVAVPRFSAVVLVCEACDAHASDEINQWTTALATVAEDGIYNGVPKNECDDRAMEICTSHGPQAVRLLDAFYEAVYAAYVAAAALGE